MHLTNKPYLKRENIDYYLEKLSLLMLNGRNKKATIYIMGGACMAMLYDGHRSTVDIDIATKDNNLSNLYCEAVANREGIPKDWINSDVMLSESFSIRLFDRALFYKSFNGVLDTYLIDDIDLLCMKLVSFRQKDVRDIKILTKILNKKHIGKKNVIDEINFLYGDTSKISRNAMYYIKTRLKY